VRFAEDVALTKEAESFQKISSFLVHDLKNLVSSLSLVLQNAERNITKPAFQQDLLETLGTTVEKMKVLIEKLSTLPKELKIHPQAVDLNALVEEAVESTKIRSIKGCSLSTDLNDVPPLMLDPEYIRKVLVNLLLNAVQALPGGKGRVEIVTYVQEGRACLEIVDSGSGMSEEFVRSRLFRPFTTTKKKGLGIGLYQCKAIVEAHGGEIAVSSIPGRGSQFTLKFPVR